jgi:SAM-dependent methyltransferase
MTEPSAVLPFSGERYTPETPGEIAYEHWHRYYAALPLARGRRVLDAACGEGYGSALMAEVAAEVIGVDLSQSSIAHARARYAGAQRLSFVEGSVTALPLEDASIDLVVSFETIEHLAEQAAMLGEFRRVLKPDGLLFISSPNKPVYSDERDFHNEFHVRELTREELAAVLTPAFPQQRWYAQRLMFHSLIWPERAHLEQVEILAQDGERAARVSEPAPAMYFLVACGGPAAQLPEDDRLSLLADRNLSIYREFERTTRAERKLYALLQERERERDDFHQKLAKAYADFDEMHSRMKDLHAHWLTMSRTLEEREAAVAALGQQLAQLQAQRSLDLEGIAALHAQQSGDAERIAQLRVKQAESAASITHLQARRAEDEASIAALQTKLTQQVADLKDLTGRLAYRETLAGWLRLPLAKLRQILARRAAPMDGISGPHG